MKGEMPMEATWRIAGDAGARQFLDAIAQAQVDQFGIPVEEARWRMMRAWHLLGDGSIKGDSDPPDLLFRESARYWASTIYYGNDSFWWITGAAREAQGLPPLQPRPLDPDEESSA